MTVTSVSPRSPALPAGLSRDQLLEMYRHLRMTRTLEERLVALYRQTKVIGGLFRSLGQEGESVASAYALERGANRDILSPLIRNLPAPASASPATVASMSTLPPAANRSPATASRTVSAPPATKTAPPMCACAWPSSAATPVA